MGNPNIETIQSIRKVKLFLAASPEEFSVESAQLGDFVRKLNDCYLDRGIYFSLTMNGDASTMADCSFALFLFGEAADRAVVDALDAALDSFRRSGQPRAATYFRETGVRPPAEEIADLQERLGKETDFYYHTYRHADALKLGLLMSIKQLDINGVDIRLENGKAWQGGDALLPLDNVEMVSGYEDLEKLKTERSTLETSFVEAKSKYAVSPEDSNLREAFIEASNRRNAAIQEIRDIETRLYHMIEGMYEQTSQGRVSHRQVEGYRLMERGMLQEARMVLNFDAIMSESRHNEEVADQTAKRAQVCVNELMQLKDVNNALHDWEGVETCFIEAARLEEKHGLPRNATIDYIFHLINQLQHEKAIEMGENLKLVFQSAETQATDKQKYMLFNYLGYAYTECQQIDKAVDMFEIALAAINARSDGNQTAIQSDVAVVQNNLGRLYDASGKYEESVKAHQAALEIRRKLVDIDSDRYEGVLASSYVNLASVLYWMERFDEAVDNLVVARDILLRIAVYKPDPHELYLVICYDNLGLAYTHLQRYEEAEAQFMAGFELLVRLADANPEALEPRIALSDRRFGFLYGKTGQAVLAKEKFDAAIELFKKCSGANAVLESELADCYLEMGEFLYDVKRYEEAEKAIQSALKIYENYKESNDFYVTMIRKAHKLLDNLSAEQNRAKATLSGLSPEEREIALLLTEGVDRREIARRMQLAPKDVALHISAIREKVSGVADANPMISAIAEKYKLTRREAEVLGYLHKNEGVDVVSSELYISDETVRTHIRNIMKKLSVEKRSEIYLWLAEYEQTC